MSVVTLPSEKTPLVVSGVAEIAFARRLSKTKFWTLVRVVEAARVVAVRGEEDVVAAIGRTDTAAAAVAAPKAPPAATAPVKADTEVAS